ncbi:MAG: hypothetical protein E7L01_03640 [Paenibacillus macerans]|uniref:hypothetical protein n=1 Tax=Paenibacillus macerans TaxID=44252 RepID=UPI001BCB2F94|nr:hypothetical protein [Paenibacillus macerans]MBS5911424.1 hypothetical protein [Paenibacillus macerans]MDU7472440.1 hypothetical protein [Paenibacillus macerans]MEC0139639.1 hypothetical protein [Paenibacillus macerans]
MAAVAELIFVTASGGGCSRIPRNAKVQASIAMLSKFVSTRHFQLHFRISSL